MVQASSIGSTNLESPIEFLRKEDIRFWFIANSLIRNKIIVSNLSKIIAQANLELHPKNDKSFLFIGQSGIKLVSSGLRIFQKIRNVYGNQSTIQIMDFRWFSAQKFGSIGGTKMLVDLWSIFPDGS